MKKILTSLAVAALSVPALAAGSFSTYDVVPAQGTVQYLDGVIITFPEWEELEIANRSDITITLNGAAYTQFNVTENENALDFTFRPAAMAPGTYVITLAPYSITGYSNNYTDYADLEETLTFTYTIEGFMGEGNFEFTANPEEGQVEELTTVTLTFTAFEEMDINNRDDIKAIYNGEAVEDCTVRANSNQLVFTFNPALTEPGDVELYIPEGSICGYDEDYNPSDLAEEISVKYTIAKLESTVYDLTITSGRPQFKTADNAGIIGPNTNIEIISVNCPVFGLKPSADAKAVLKSEDGSFESEAPLRFNMQNNSGTNVYTQFKMAFPQLPKADGNYSITIAKGSFGDEAWIANPATGRSNDEITLEYVFEGFSASGNVAYNLSPAEVSPEPNNTVKSLATIVLTFDERVYDTTRGDIVLTNIVNRYTETPSVSVSGKVVTLTFAKEPTLYGDYSLIISKGRFANNDYMEDPDTGSLNDDLFYTWTLSVDTGINGIVSADEEAPVYNIMGVKVSETLEGLPAGIYVQGGRKVIVK